MIVDAVATGFFDKAGEYCRKGANRAAEQHAADQPRAGAAISAGDRLVHRRNDRYMMKRIYDIQQSRIGRAFVG